jgi:hypothetical protein
MFADSVFYGFRPSKVFNNKKLEAFKLEWKKYVVIPNIRYMDGMMRKEKARQKFTKEKLEKYNEFED